MKKFEVNKTGNNSLVTTVYALSYKIEKGSINFMIHGGELVASFPAKKFWVKKVGD